MAIIGQEQPASIADLITNTAPPPLDAQQWIDLRSYRLRRVQRRLEAQGIGGREGVKLEEQILITESGCELLSTYPMDEFLLA